MGSAHRPDGLPPSALPPPAGLPMPTFRTAPPQLAVGCNVVPHQTELLGPEASSRAASLFPVPSTGQLSSAGWRAPGDSIAGVRNCAGTGAQRGQRRRQSPDPELSLPRPHGSHPQPTFSLAEALPAQAAQPRLPTSHHPGGLSVWGGVSLPAPPPPSGRLLRFTTPGPSPQPPGTSRSLPQGLPHASPQSGQYSQDGPWAGAEPADTLRHACAPGTHMRRHQRRPRSQVRRP